MSDTQAITDELIQLIKASTLKELQQSLAEYHPSDLADTFVLLDEDRRNILLKTLNFHLLAKIFEYLEPEIAAKYTNVLEFQKIANIFNNMDPDDATDIIKNINADHVNAILALLPEDTRLNLSTLSKFKEETAGAIMTTDFIALKKGMDVKEAMKRLVSDAKTTEGIQKLFVLDDNAFLEGVIELKTLIQARSPKNIDDLMRTDVTTVYVDDDAEEVARKIQNYGMYLMPVVNDKNQMQGVITLDDAADILDQETDEDYGLFAGLSSDIVLKDTIVKSALHRLPWLIILLFLGLIISTIISRFESTIDRIAVLVIFQPLILDMAGNTGTQSLAVTVRGLSKQMFTFKGQARRHLFKEFRIGVLNGVAIGIFSIISTFVFLTIANPTMTTGTPLQVALTVGISAFFALSVAAGFGTFIPLLLNRLNFDPAVASGPFITTLNDIIGLVIYFTLAILIIL